MLKSKTNQAALAMILPMIVRLTQSIRSYVIFYFYLPASNILPLFTLLLPQWISCYLSNMPGILATYGGKKEGMPEGDHSISKVMAVKELSVIEISVIGDKPMQDTGLAK